MPPKKAAVTSLLLERAGTRKLAARPATLAEALAKAATAFSLPAGTVALEALLAGAWAEVLDDAWGLPVLASQDPLVLRVADKAGVLAKVAQKKQKSKRAISSDEDDSDDGHVCSKARLDKRVPTPAAIMAAPRASSSVSRRGLRSSDAGFDQTPLPIFAAASSPNNRITVTIFTVSGSEGLQVKCLRTTPFSKVFHAYANKVGRDRQELRFVSDGQYLQDNDTAEALEMEDDDTWLAQLVQTGGKPVICTPLTLDLHSTTMLTPRRRPLPARAAFPRPGRPHPRPSVELLGTVSRRTASPLEGARGWLRRVLDRLREARRRARRVLDGPRALVPLLGSDDDFHTAFSNASPHFLANHCL